MPRENNKDGFDQVLGILFGVLAVFILVICFSTGDVSILWNISGRGIPVIFLVVLGFIALYYALKK